MDNQNKIAYLQLIQEPINRLSSISAIIKGFCITVFSGLTCLYFEKENIFILLINLIAIIFFASMDIYYLSLERRYRHLYNLVIKDKKSIDFSMKLIGTKEESNSRIRDCVTSFCIWFFYSIPIVLLIFLYHFSAMEVI